MPLAEALPVRGPQPRILILRISALGDLVFATALLDGLRARFPEAHIAWAAQAGFAALLEDDPRVNQVLALPAGWLRRPWTWPALRRSLSDGGFDWVIDAQGLVKTRLLARWTAGATRIGFDSREPGRGWMDHLFPKGGDLREISSEYRFLAREITGREPGAPRLLPGAAARERVAAAMTRLGLAAGFTALCPFTTRPQKHWPETSWPDLAQRLHAAGAGPLALFGGPADRAAAARMFRGFPPGSVNLAGETRLADLPAWLEAAALVIGVDTGLTHIGIATGRPVLALFGSTRPYTQGAPAPLAVLYEDLACAPCRRHPVCNGTFACMRLLTPERVAASAAQLLQRA